MATLILQAAGQALGGLLGPVGAIVGRAAGTIAGGLVDGRLLGGGGVREIGRLDDLSVQTSSDGNPVPRVYGRMRLAGTVIWATEFEEEVSETGGGKGGPSVREFSYYANFAVGLCEGPISRVSRVWADGKRLDIENLGVRIYNGEDDQPADPLIEAKQDGEAPAYRGLAYVVFERLPVGEFGNRLPQLTFEVIRSVDRLEERVRGITVIPGSTEFGYHTTHVKRQIGPGETETDNRHLGVGETDFVASIDELVAVCPNLKSVALVVAWFADDLRAAHCRIEPAVELSDRPTLGAQWSVAGLDRNGARTVSALDGRPAYGGTPSDGSVVAAIEALKARGLEVVFYPFLLMDIAPGNGKPDPYGGSEQAAYPWRGRITLDPAPGEPGSPDKTAAAAGQIAAIVGTAGPQHFSVGSGSVSYTGPTQWTLRRMTLHYAALAAAAGGVDAFLIGSELRGLTTARSGVATFPFVDHLVSLAADVRSIVGAGTKVSYAADWSEYFGHQPGDGSGDALFHLDPLWAAPDVDVVGIDCYWPLADWRAGDHLDGDVADNPHDLAYLGGNVAGGEGFDWFYASLQDRFDQTRSAIADGSYGKDWVFRYKDLQGWWSNQHFDRIGGVEQASPTAWVPMSKPFWFTEVGCPAVDKGANQPNVFYDPKSSESFFPYFSNGSRDDGMQRRYAEALIDHFDPADAGLADVNNPVSPLYGGRMLDADAIHLWTWDARPWPAFPFRSDVWADGPNWERGHWLTGRLGGTSLAGLVRALFADYGLEAPEIRGLDHTLDGFIATGPSSLRELIEPLARAFVFAATDTGTAIRFVDRNQRPAITVGPDDLVDEGPDEAMTRRVRDEEHALPVEQRLSYLDSGRDFSAATARYRRLLGDGRGTMGDAVPAALGEGVAAKATEVLLEDFWARRNELTLALPPSLFALQAGDVIDVAIGDLVGLYFLEDIEDAGRRQITGRSLDRLAFGAIAPAPGDGSGGGGDPLPAFGPPVVHLLDLPVFDESGVHHEPYLAVFARPWPGTVGLWRSVSGSTFSLAATTDSWAMMGEILAPPAAGPVWRWDRPNELTVRLYRGAPASRDPLDVLGGSNLLAARADDGRWQLLQFELATLIDDQTYRLERLITGQAGTEDIQALGLSAGAPVVFVDSRVTQIPLARDQLGLDFTYRAGPAQEGVGGEAIKEFSHSASGRGLMPLSPVHLSARPDAANGSIALAWIRRTRIGGDSWEVEEVPLGEESEIYRVEILDGATVVRTEEVGAPTFVYTLAAQQADFGAALTTITFRVAQVAPGFGAGVPAEVTLDVG